MSTILKNRHSEIGGGIVRRTFNSCGRQLSNGMRLSRDEVLGMRVANRNALVDKGYLELFPLSTGPATEIAKPVATSPASGRFVISVGFGNFHVIEGRRLTEEPIGRDQAYALAGISPEKPKAKRKAKVAA